MHRMHTHEERGTYLKLQLNIPANVRHLLLHPAVNGSPLPLCFSFRPAGSVLYDSQPQIRTTICRLV